MCVNVFPISRDPPEGGTDEIEMFAGFDGSLFPISRDPPEGGTKPSSGDLRSHHPRSRGVSNF